MCILDLLIIKLLSQIKHKHRKKKWIYIYNIYSSPQVACIKHQKKKNQHCVIINNVLYQINVMLHMLVLKEYLSVHRSCLCSFGFRQWLHQFKLGVRQALLCNFGLLGRENRSYSSHIKYYIQQLAVLQYKQQTSVYFVKVTYQNHFSGLRF